MSHTASVKSISIQSITALRAAIEELSQTGIRCTLVADAKPRAFYSDQQGMGKADYVVQLADCKYDIGLYKTEDGKGFEARTDFWGGHIEKILGSVASSPETAAQAKMGKLFQMYGIHAATEAARKKGHMVRRITKADGVMALEITGPNL